MTAIYKRELRALFHSMIGWVFLAMNLFFAGLYFMALNLFYGSPSIAGTVMSILFMLIVTIPVLSMRTMAEDRRQKTDQLILTAPVSIFQIVLGKYLAAVTVFTVLAAALLLQPLVLHHFGEVSYSESYTALLGYFVYGLAGLAVGLFVSSLTESQVIAAAVTFAALLLTYMMPGIRGLMAGNTGTAAGILESLDFFGRFNAFAEAKLDWSALIYFLSIAILMLFLTGQSIQKRRWSVTVKNYSLGACGGARILIACVVCVAVNIAAGRIPAAYKTIDMTQQKLYTLSSQSKALLKELGEDVRIYVLQTRDNSDPTLNSMLDNYAGQSGHLTVEYVDPARNPNFHSKYTADETLTINSLIVESDRRYKVIPYDSLYETGYDSYYYSEVTTGYDGEGQVTGAIAYVTSDAMPKMYAITGHDEMELSAAFLDAVQKQNIELASLNLLDCARAPEDAACILINAPAGDLSEDDLEKLTAYADGGGSLFVTTAFTDDRQDNLHKLLSLYGICPVEGMVVEESGEHYYQSKYYLLPNIEEDAVTQELKRQNYIFMPYAMGFRVDAAWEERVTPLLTSSDKSYSKVSFTDTESLVKEEGDIEGPFILALRAVRESGREASTLYLFGSEVLFTDTADEAVAGNNLALFTHSLGSLGGYQTSVLVPVKSYELSQIMVPASAGTVFGIVFTLVLPGCLLAGGIMSCCRRRKYR